MVRVSLVCVLAAAVAIALTSAWWTDEVRSDGQADAKTKGIDVRPESDSDVKVAASPGGRALQSSSSSSSQEWAVTFGKLMAQIPEVGPVGLEMKEAPRPTILPSPPFASHVDDLKAKASEGNGRAAAELLRIYRYCSDAYDQSSVSAAAEEARYTRFIRMADEGPETAVNIPSEADIEIAIEEMLLAPSRNCEGVHLPQESYLAALSDQAIEYDSFLAIEEAREYLAQGDVGSAGRAFWSAWRAGRFLALQELAEATATSPGWNPDVELSAEALAFAYYQAYMSISRAFITNPGPITQRRLARDEAALLQLQGNVFPHERPKAREYSAKIIQNNEACCVF
jgi:hypothetical protein